MPVVVCLSYALANLCIVAALEIQPAAVHICTMNVTKRVPALSWSCNGTVTFSAELPGQIDFPTDGAAPFAIASHPQLSPTSSSDSTASFLVHMAPLTSASIKDASVYMRNRAAAGFSLDASQCQGVLLREAEATAADHRGRHRDRELASRDPQTEQLLVMYTWLQRAVSKLSPDALADLEVFNSITSSPDASNEVPCGPLTAYVSPLRTGALSLCGWSSLHPRGAPANILMDSLGRPLRTIAEVAAAVPIPLVQTCCSSGQVERGAAVALLHGYSGVAVQLLQLAADEIRRRFAASKHQPTTTTATATGAGAVRRNSLTHNAVSSSIPYSGPPPSHAELLQLTAMAVAGCPGPAVAMHDNDDRDGLDGHGAPNVSASSYNNSSGGSSMNQTSAAQRDATRAVWLTSCRSLMTRIDGRRHPYLKVMLTVLVEVADPALVTTPMAGTAAPVGVALHHPQPTAPAANKRGASAVTQADKPKNHNAAIGRVKHNVDTLFPDPAASGGGATSQRGMDGAHSDAISAATGLNDASADRGIARSVADAATTVPIYMSPSLRPQQPSPALQSLLAQQQQLQQQQHHRTSHHDHDLFSLGAPAASAGSGVAGAAPGSSASSAVQSASASAAVSPLLGSLLPMQHQHQQPPTHSRLNPDHHGQHQHQHQHEASSAVNAALSYSQVYGDDGVSALGSAPAEEHIEISLHDRVGFACRFLDDVTLPAYIRRITAECIAAGRIDGLILTGLTADGCALVQRYLDVTGDVQTAGTLAVYFIRALQMAMIAHTFTNAPAVATTTPAPAAASLLAALSSSQLHVGRSSWRWLQSYRDLLNHWQLWHCRAKIDIQRAKMLSYQHRPTKNTAAGGGGSELLAGTVHAANSSVGTSGDVANLEHACYLELVSLAQQLPNASSSGDQQGTHQHVHQTLHSSPYPLAIIQPPLPVTASGAASGSGTAGSAATASGQTAAAGDAASGTSAPASAPSAAAAAAPSSAPLPAPSRSSHTPLSLIPPTNQLYVKCSACKTSLHLPSLVENSATAVEWLSKQRPHMLSCPNCRKHLPRCELCLLPLGLINPVMQLQHEMAQRNAYAVRSSGLGGGGAGVGGGGVTPLLTAQHQQLHLQQFGLGMPDFAAASGFPGLGGGGALGFMGAGITGHDAASSTVFAPSGVLAGSSTSASSSANSGTFAGGLGIGSGLGPGLTAGGGGLNLNSIATPLLGGLPMPITGGGYHQHHHQQHHTSGSTGFGAAQAGDIGGGGDAGHGGSSGGGLLLERDMPAGLAGDDDGEGGRYRYGGLDIMSHGPSGGSGDTSGRGTVLIDHTHSDGHGSSSSSTAASHGQHPLHPRHHPIDDASLQLAGRLRDAMRFDEFWCWCQSCKHGGHASHLADWFSSKTVCPVAECMCHCIKQDSSYATAMRSVVPVPAVHR